MNVAHKKPLGLVNHSFSGERQEIKVNETESDFYDNTSLYLKDCIRQKVEHLWQASTSLTAAR